MNGGKSPWLLIGAVVIVILFVLNIAGYLDYRLCGLKWCKRVENRADVRK